MELPILYALTHPARLPDEGVRRFDPVAAGTLTFEPVRTDVFRALAAGVAAGRAGGISPAVFNAANEVAVAAFLAGERVLRPHQRDHRARARRSYSGPATSVPAVREADRWARVRARDYVRSVRSSC